MSDPQGLPPGAQIVAGPERVGSEQRWRVRLVDGRAALLARLAPELARDLALRRRYVRDLGRLQTLTGGGGVPGVAPVLGLGPEPDAAAADAAQLSGQPQPGRSQRHQDRSHRHTVVGR